MIEGQEGVTWEQWLALARACEEHGLEGLFRSDHYGGVYRRDLGTLDAWTTLAALGARTQRIRLGTMVSPVTFRHPSALAKAVVTADHISGGRVELGLGAGWNEDEHRAYGFPFPERSVRLEQLAEQAEIIRRQWTEDEVDFAGRHYRLERCRALPKPLQQPPPLIVGGQGKRGTIEPAARFADEYNTAFADADELRRRRRLLDEACERAGRDPAAVRLSVAMLAAVGTDRAEVERRVRRTAELAGLAEEALRERAPLVGTLDEAAERLAELEAAGVERVYVQSLDHADLEYVALLARLR
jgi:F420-dependent oxidoreductase-like protein